MSKKLQTKALSDDHESSAPRGITQTLGVDPVLPGESSTHYRQGLRALISELDAKTVLQIYLAEKIYECLWWIRRYEEQKRATIIAEMASQANGRGYSDSLNRGQVELRESLLTNNLDKDGLKLIADAGHSVESLRQSAMSRKRGEIQLLDNQISLQTKILAGLQASYEVAVNRKRNAERLELQNALIRRDLGAFEANVYVDPKTKHR